jgi:hypothetical protein
VVIMALPRSLSRKGKWPEAFIIGSQHTGGQPLLISSRRQLLPYDCAIRGFTETPSTYDHPSLRT